MDSLKLPKGSSSSASSPGSGKSPSIPLAIRFNADEESIENIIVKPSESLSSSPQHSEDFSWRKEFLQGGFFHRKRSGSIEGASSSSGSTNIVSNLSSSDTNTVGAWKMIKGKVSQAMEDIKSSKSSNTQSTLNQSQQQTTSGGGGTTDDNIDDLLITSNILNNSASDEISPENSINLNNPNMTITGNKLDDSDSDVDSDIFQPSSDELCPPTWTTPTAAISAPIASVSASFLRKSFSNIRGRVTAASATSTTSTIVTTTTTPPPPPSTNTVSGAAAISVVGQRKSKQDELLPSLQPSGVSDMATPSPPASRSNIRSTFLRKRRKANPVSKSPAESQSGSPKKDTEIESGVEMLEDMILPAATLGGGSTAIVSSTHADSDQGHFDQFGSSTSSNNRTIKAGNTDTSSYTKTISMEQSDGGRTNNSMLYIFDNKILFKNRETAADIQIVPNPNKIVNPTDMATLSTQSATAYGSTDQERNRTSQFRMFMDKIVRNTHSIIDIFHIFCYILKNLYDNRTILITILLLISLMILPLPAFFHGVIACLFTIFLFSSLSDFVSNLLTNFYGSHGPEKNKFQIPSYSTMPICQIPAVEEHKPLKSYSGWMNEINNYDPTTYHISMTRSVFLRLDGSILRISNTTTRVPKRAIWNEAVLEKKSLIFTHNRYFNLLGCRVEMLPRGLARKRYFSRKYPIQLIIKNLETTKNEEADTISPECQESMDLQSCMGYQNLSNAGQSQVSGCNANNSAIDVDNLTHQNSNDSNEDRGCNATVIDDLDFGSTILNSDLQKLQQDTNDPIPKDTTVPCGDETRLLLFARCDREKEDWYRRFYAASIGEINDQDIRIPDIVMISDEDVASAIRATSGDVETEQPPVDDSNIKTAANSPNSTGETSCDTKNQKRDKSVDDGLFEGLLLTTCAARSPPDYITFMSKYQKACNGRTPVIKRSTSDTHTSSKRNRRQKKQEDELWKGIDQNLYLGPTSNVIWANVLIGRILYSCLNDAILLNKIQEFLQKKLSAIRLPSFMEDVGIAQVDLGNTPPLIHRVSQPIQDERGTWIDADLTYEGLMHMTITTKLNLLRLKKQQHTHTGCIPMPMDGGGGGMTTTNATTTPITMTSVTSTASHGNFGANSNPASDNGGTSSAVTNSHITSTAVNSNLGTSTGSMTASNEFSTAANQTGLSHTSVGGATAPANSPAGGGSVGDGSGGSSNMATSGSPIIANSCAIYDSNAESSGASSSESESPTMGSIDPTSESASQTAGSFYATPGSSRRLLRIVDRITASNLFQSATEIPYIQRAMENMSTKITLRVELKGLVSRVVINLPPPPSDRIWIAFRGPPRLWISAKPAVGDHTFDWSIVTNVIESKLCDEVYKYLVYPNMVDIIAPFLGQSTYKE